MKFSKEQMLKLTNIWKEKEEVTIKGVNSFGEEFVTTGRITTTDNGKIGVNDKLGVIYLEFGATKDWATRKQTRYFAPFITSTGEEILCNLYVLSVEHNEEAIIENPDKEQIIIKITEENQKRIELLKKQGREEVVDCEVVNELKKMVAKPIIIDGDYGVFAGINGSNFLGNPIIELLVGNGVGGVFVSRQSVLYTETNNGEFVKLAENDANKYIENLKPIIKKINKHSQEKQ